MPDTKSEELAIAIHAALVDLDMLTHENEVCPIWIIEVAIDNHLSAKQANAQVGWS